MSVNSRFKAIYVTGQRNELYRERIPEYSCETEEAVDIEILVISRNGDKKNQAIYQNNK